METIILKGEAARERIFSSTKKEVADLRLRTGTVPGIAFIAFEGVPLAKYSVPLHVGMAEEAGFRVRLEMLPADISEEELLDHVSVLNNDPDIHAVVVMQPVPVHIHSMRIANAILPEKEVEGFHPQNMLSTLLPDVIPNRYPMCLPTAFGEIFSESGIRPLPDQEWLFLLDEEFLRNPLTRMIVHTSALKVVPDDNSMTFMTPGSAKLVDACRRADFLVIITKHPGSVNPEWLKPGVCIIDIYSNLVKEVPSKTDPSKIVPVIRGGISAEAARGIAGAILPIPGGLMVTVLGILLNNALMAFRLQTHMQ